MDNGKQSDQPVSWRKSMESAFEDIESALDQLQKSRLCRQEKDARDFFPSITNYCVVCKMPRLIGDATGVTCGQAKCLAALGEMIWETEEIKKEKKDSMDELFKVAKALKIDVTPYSDDMAGLCEALTEELGGIEILVDNLKALKR